MNPEAERKKLSEYLAPFAAKKASLKNAFLEVKRENFVPEEYRRDAYKDAALPIGFGQTISQPSTIAVMLELLDVKEGQKILEVGSGCGYASALLSKIAGEKGRVFGTELIKELAEASEKNLEKEKILNVKILNKDGSKGLEEEAPFDRILMSCACPFIPKELFDQLNEGGKVIAPVGDLDGQQLTLMTKVNGEPRKSTYLGGLYAFVPLRGKNSYSSIR